jgi:hypothetical protein
MIGTICCIAEAIRLRGFIRCAAIFCPLRHFASFDVLQRCGRYRDIADKGLREGRIGPQRLTQSDHSHQIVPVLALVSMTVESRRCQQFQYCLYLGCAVAKGILIAETRKNYVPFEFYLLCAGLYGESVTTFPYHSPTGSGN